MRWKQLLAMVLIVAACGSDGQVTATSPASTASTDTATSQGDPRTDLSDARSRWSVEGPDRYLMETAENWPECDVIPSRNIVIDGVPFALGRDSFRRTMELMFDEYERTLGHEQYDDHSASFDPETGALRSWRAAFFPVGGNPTERGHDIRLEPAEDIELLNLAAFREDMDCPTDGWQEVAVGAFIISLPADLEDSGLEGVDSEVGEWMGTDLDVDWDYGWYSNPVDASADGRTFFANGSVTGVEVVGANRVSVHYPQVVQEGGEWNALTLNVHHTGADQLALCVARSLDLRG